MEDTVRNFAIDWQDWASQQNLSYEDLSRWQSVILEMALLSTTGELIEELKENGIL